MANRIIELQKMFQASQKPLWMRHPRSAFYVYPYYAMFFVGVTVPFYYVARSIVGKKAHD
ncbi:hypothetical protein ACO0RG_003045 [Hanseniaspora osmophila]